MATSGFSKEAFPEVSVQNVCFCFGEEKGFTGQGHAKTNQRDAPGQDTRRSEGHLSSYLLGGAPGGEAPGNM
jgi:hypothetical protein